MPSFYSAYVGIGSPDGYQRLVSYQREYCMSKKRVGRWVENGAMRVRVCTLVQNDDFGLLGLAHGEHPFRPQA